MPKTYRVADRGMPKEVRMIANDKGKEWFAGDAIAPGDIDKDSWEWMLRDGVIEEVESSPSNPA